MKKSIMPQPSFLSLVLLTLLCVTSLEIAAKNPEPINQDKENNEHLRSNAQVSAGNSFWGVAKALKPESVTQYQAMAALMRKNPEAFAGGSYQNLKPNVVLRLPSLAEYASEPVDGAKSYYDEQKASSAAQASPPKLYSLNANDAPKKAEVAKADSTKAETNKNETKSAKAEAVKLSKIEAAKTELAKAEAAKLNKNETIKNDQAKLEQTKSDVTKLSKVDVAKTGVAKVEATKNEDLKAAALKKETVKVETAKKEIIKTEAAKKDIISAGAPKKEVLKPIQVAVANAEPIKGAKSVATREKERSKEPIKEPAKEPVKEQVEQIKVKKAVTEIAVPATSPVIDNREIKELNNNIGKVQQDVIVPSTNKLPELNQSTSLPTASTIVSSPTAVNENVTVLTFPPPAKELISESAPAPEGMTREKKINLVMIIAAIVAFLGLIATIGSKFLRFGKSENNKNQAVINPQTSKDASKVSSDDILFSKYPTPSFDQPASEEILRAKSQETSEINKNPVADKQVARTNNLANTTEAISTPAKITALGSATAVADLQPEIITAVDEEIKPASEGTEPIIANNSLPEISQRDNINATNLPAEKEASTDIGAANYSEEESKLANSQQHILESEKAANSNINEQVSSIASTVQAAVVFNNSNQNSPATKPSTITQGGLPPKQMINHLSESKYIAVAKELAPAANAQELTNDGENSAIPQAIGNRKTKMNIVKVLEDIESTLANPDDKSSAQQAEEYGKKLLQSDGPDSTAYKLRMAEPYFELGLDDLAHELLQEVCASGSTQQRLEAEQLISKYANRKK